MKSREALISAQERNPGKPVPLRLSVPITTWQKHRQPLLDLILEYSDVTDSGFGPGDKPWERDQPRGYSVGETYTDLWGCQLRNVHEGVDGLIVTHPLDDWSKLDAYQVPDTLHYTDMGEPRDWNGIAGTFAQIIEQGGFPGGTMARFLYQRLHMLRGYENFFADIAEDSPNLHRLADMITDANMRIIEKYLDLGAVFFSFGDHLGMQDRFPMSAEAWERVFLPRYGRMFRRIRQAGGRSSFYSDGHTMPIWEGFIEAGVTALRVQANCNRIEDIAGLLKGRVNITYDMDRQYLLPRGTPGEIDENIRNAVETLGSPDGGLAICARIELDTPLENLRSLLESMRRHRGKWVA